MGKQQFTFFFTLFIVFFHLTLPLIFTNITMALLVLNVLIDKNSATKLISLFRTKQFWILLSPFLLLCISAIYSSDTARAWKEIELRLPLFIFPLVYGLSPVSKKNSEIILKFFVLLVCIIPIIGLFSKLGIYFETSDSGYFYNDHLVDYVRKQAAYFALYVNIALVSVFYFWMNKKEKPNWERGLLLGVVFLLVSIQYLLASRMGMVIMLGLFVAFFMNQLFTNSSKKQILGMITGFVIIVVGIAVLFPKALKRFDSITHIEYQFDNINPINHFNGEIKRENWNGLNTRLALWNCAWDVTKDNPIIGTGIGDVQSDLVKNYKEKNFIFAIESNYNSHNQYLDILLSSGFLGLIIFLYFLGSLIVISIKHQKWLLLGIIITFALSSVTENILNRNQGIIMVALLISVLSFSRNKQIEKK